MDSDKVLVMDAGEAVEFGVPHILLQNSSGHFTSMVRETGNHMETKLREVARKTYEEHEYAEEISLIKEDEQNQQNLSNDNE